MANFSATSPLAESVLLDLVEQRAVADLEQARRAGAVAARALERAPDQLDLERARRLLDRELGGDRLGRDHRAARAIAPRPQVLDQEARVDPRAIGQDQHPLDRVLELAHVTR